MLCGLLLAAWAGSQTTATIGNNDILKMVQAKLPDDLIVEIINTTPAVFDMADVNMKTLTSAGVSARIVEAMKKTGKVLKPSTREIEVLAYITPVKELVKYYENEFRSISDMMNSWDESIRKSMVEAEKLNQQILETEAALRLLKNADPKKFSKEIIEKKQKLTEERGALKTLKIKMLEEGAAIREKLGSTSSAGSKSTGKIYGEVSQMIKSSVTDPSKGVNASKLTLNRLDIREPNSVMLEPLTHILYWHQNEIDEVEKLIGEWNPKIREIVKQDEEQLKLLEPLLKQQNEYKTDSKTYKTELATLKKQIAEIEKERKMLASKMAEDCKILSDSLKDTGTVLQSIIEERFNDIIANINYVYQEKFQL